MGRINSVLKADPRVFAILHGTVRHKAKDISCRAFIAILPSKGFLLIFFNRFESPRRTVEVVVFSASFSKRRTRRFAFSRQDFRGPRKRMDGCHGL